jgi:hypothetical protein
LVQASKSWRGGGIHRHTGWRSHKPTLGKWAKKQTLSHPDCMHHYNNATTTDKYCHIRPDRILPKVNILYEATSVYCELINIKFGTVIGVLS